MLKTLITALVAVFGAVVSPAAFADRATLTLSPAITTETHGNTVVVGQRLAFSLEPGISDIQTATLNLTRAGRVVGEYAMRNEGTRWTVAVKLELPYAYVATVRLYEQQRVWAGATDLYALESEDASQVKPSDTLALPLELTVTDGKPGGDANPWWGILAALALVVGVGLGTQVIRRKPKGAAS
jgi:hypothetical protein